jgi:RNA polymerase sigma factor (sigma-70 family)
MSMVHPEAHSVTYACAQAGCGVCANELVRQHRKLVLTILRRQFRHDLPYEDLFQEGLIALWQAILHFDPQRGYSFSTYAGTAIARRIWLAVARMSRPQGFLAPPELPDPAERAIQEGWYTLLRAALRQTLARLPGRMQYLLVAYYGLDGQAPQTLTAIGRHLGLTGERTRQLRNEALHLLRLPAFSAPLRLLCDQHDRLAYRHARAVRRTYQRTQRRRRRQP